jgi:hypothetical protein
VFVHPSLLIPSKVDVLAPRMDIYLPLRDFIAIPPNQYFSISTLLLYHNTMILASGIYESKRKKALAKGCFS